MSRRKYKPGDTYFIRRAYKDLCEARDALKTAGARKTLARVRLAISSCKGAIRNIDMLKHSAERKARA